jgi:haloalkane dehalogenase
MLPLLNRQNIRTIAPDIPGFGLSTSLPGNEYSLSSLSSVLRQFVAAIDLDGFHIYANDWGVLIGLTLLSEIPNKIHSVILSNGCLPVIGSKPSLQFQLWKYFTKYSPFLPVSTIINCESYYKLTPEEKKGYGFPFKNNKNKSGIRKLPNLIPDDPSHPEVGLINNIWKLLDKTEVPVLAVFSSNDSYTKEGFQIIQKKIPGAKEQPHKKLKAKHFITEDAPEELVSEILSFINKNNRQI